MPSIDAAQPGIFTDLDSGTAEIIATCMTTLVESTRDEIITYFNQNELTARYNLYRSIRFLHNEITDLISQLGIVAGYQNESEAQKNFALLADEIRIRFIDIVGELLLYELPTDELRADVYGAQEEH